MKILFNRLIASLRRLGRQGESKTHSVAVVPPSAAEYAKIKKGGGSPQITAPKTSIKSGTFKLSKGSVNPIRKPEPYVSAAELALVKEHSFRNVARVAKTKGIRWRNRAELYIKLGYDPELMVQIESNYILKEEGLVAKQARDPLGPKATREELRANAIKNLAEMFKELETK